MLILKLAIDEKVFIGNDIEIMLVSVQGLEAKVGFKAPEHIAIDRECVRQQIIANGGVRSKRKSTPKPPVPRVES